MARVHCLIGLVFVVLVPCSAQPGPGEPGYVPPVVRDDPLTQEVGKLVHTFIEENPCGLRLSKLWEIDLENYQTYLLASSSDEAQAKGLELSPWGAGFAAGGSRQGSAFLIHVVRCSSAENASELLGLLRANVQADHDRINKKMAPAGVQFPPLQEVELKTASGFGFDALPNLGTKLAEDQRNGKLGFTCGRVVVYCEAINNFGLESLKVLGTRLLGAIGEDAKRAGPAKQE